MPEINAMKQSITLFLSLIALVNIGAQNAPVDFETGGFGADWTWTVFENAGNPALEFVANPDPNTLNSSSTVAKFTALAQGAPFAGCETEHGSDIGNFTLDAETSTISIMVYKSVISNVGIKLVESSSASLGEILIPNTLINEWETITFDFSSMEGILYDQIVVFPDFAQRSEDHIIYFDNITFGESVPLAVPMQAAPSPTIDASLVYSLYSEVYSNNDVDTWLTPWSNASIDDILIAGDENKLYTNLDFAGIETTGPNIIDASEMDYFHMDVWSPNFTLFRIKLVDFGADGMFDGGDDSEHEMTFEGISQEMWWSFQLPLTDFTGLNSTSHIAQIIISAQPVGGAVVYMDNVYFSQNPTGLSEVEETRFKVFPNPTQNYLINDSELMLTNIQVYDLNGKMVLNQSRWNSGAELNVSELKEGSYVINALNGSTQISSPFIKD